MDYNSEEDTATLSYESNQNENTKSDSDDSSFDESCEGGSSEKPVQLVKFELPSGLDTSFKIVIDNTALNSLCEKCRDHKICTICITGHRRSGKSLLANFILQKLKSGKFNKKEWFTGIRRLSGFKYAAGYKASTHGIWVWNNPHLVEVDGEKIAVILMDAQGVDDELSSKEEIMAMTGIPLLFSSILIVNLIDENIENVGKWLSPFLNTQMLSTHYQEGFQKISILMRDWTKVTKFAFGEKGGSRFLKDKKRHDSTLETMSSCFQSVECVLLPNIGEKALLQNFNGNTEKVNKDFRSRMNTYVNSLLEPENLPMKSLFDNTLTIQNFKHFMLEYQSIFNQFFLNDCSKLNLEHIRIANLGAASQIKISAALKAYQDAFIRHNKHSAKQYLRKPIVNTVSSNARRKCLQVFKEMQVPKSDEKKMKAELEQALAIETQNVIRTNQLAREKFIEETIQNATKSLSKLLRADYPLSLSFDDPSNIIFYEERKLQDYISQCSEEIIGTFMEEFEDEEDNEAEHLHANVSGQMKILQAEYLSLNLKCQSEARKHAAETINHLYESYLESMDEIQNDVGKLSPDALSKFHLREFKKIERKFVSRKLVSCLEEEYMRILTDKIQSNFDTRENKLTGSKSRKNTFDTLRKKPTPKLLKLDAANIDPPHQNKAALLKLDDDQSTLVQTHNGQLQTVENDVIRFFEEDVNSRLSTDEFSETSQLQIYLASAEEQSLKIFDDTVIKLDLPEEVFCEVEISREELSANINEYIEYILEIDTASKMYNNELDTNMRKAVTEVYEETALLEEHSRFKQATLEQLNCHRNKKYDNVFLVYLEKVEKRSCEIFSQIQNFFRLIHKGKNLDLENAIFSAKKSYREEMDRHFANSSNNHLKQDELLRVHQEVKEFVLKGVEAEFQLHDRKLAELEVHLEKLYENYLEKNDLIAQSFIDKQPAIGIDLGTTYCCVGVYHHGKVQILRNSIGLNTTPSIVTINADGATLVGQPAKELAYKNPTNTIFDAKRIIGRRVDDVELQNDMKHWPFVVESGDDNIAKIRVHDKHYHPEEVMSYLLKHLKNDAEKTLGLEITKAVITVPAYFTDGQRKATIDAGELAGIKVLEILNEPSAAAIAYRLEWFHEDNSKIVVVFDLGGGTFDVAVVRMSKAKLEVLSVGGDAHLGGEDFDTILTNYCAEEFHKETGTDPFLGKDSDKKRDRDKARRRMRRLQLKCETGKKELTTALSTTINIELFADNKDLMVEVTRDQFEKLNAELFQKTIRTTDNVLNSANVRKEQVDEIVLVGGSTRIQKLQEMLRAHFNGKALNYKVNPDEAVAYGAAVHAAIINSTSRTNLFDFGKIQEVTPMSLGIQTSNGVFDIIIPKNSKFPIEAQQKYETSRAGQTSVSISIFQGENRNAIENKFLGKFVLEGIPPSKNKIEQVDVTMQIDHNGVLNVKAQCTSTGKFNEITVVEDSGRLNKQQKEKLIEA